jgi:hypothetical protein
MGESGQAHGMHRQAAERGEDPHAIGLAVAVGVFPELRVTGPVPGIVDRTGLFRRRSTDHG